MSAQRVLIVDDEPDVVEFLSTASRMCGFEPIGVGDFDAFRDVYESNELSLIVLDLMMPETDGIEFLDYLATRDCRTAIALMSGYDRRVLKTASRIGVAERLNILATVEKPIAYEAFEGLLRRVASKQTTLSAADIRAAMEGEEIVLFYQPKVLLAKDAPLPAGGPRIDLGGAAPAAADRGAAGNGAAAARCWGVDGFEALARWRSPEHGLLPPGAFLPVAESKGLMGPLTDHLFRQCLRQVQTWQQQGLESRYAINLSASLLDDLQLPDRFARWAGEFGVDAERIVIEVTENAAIANLERSMQILGRLRLKGFQLSMDDFGTGYSSLLHLYKLPFSELKIDRTFVAEAAVDADAASIVRLIGDLADILGVRVCAEGVEDSETVRLLTDANCDLAQGYYFSKPLPSEKLWETVMSA